MGKMMRYSQSEKMEIIRLVEDSKLSARRTLEELNINRSTFYRWNRNYLKDGYDGLKNNKTGPRRFWNKIPDFEKTMIVEKALEMPEKTPRELAWHITDKNEYYISESSIYRILKSHGLITSPAYIVISAADKFKHPTKRVNQLWQTDFTYFIIKGWGHFYLAAVLDDYSRYIITWKLFTSMKSCDVKELIDRAFEITGMKDVPIKSKPRLLTDNGPCYLAEDLKSYLSKIGMEHTRGAPYHPQTQGKIERFHRSLKIHILLNHYLLPGALNYEVGKFIDYYNNERYHEGINNMIPADVYFGRTKEIADKLIVDGYNADALHGDLSQAQRDVVMNRFRDEYLQLLVATDVAARGLDVNSLSHIINYNLPEDPDIYLHRSGRTGRAGKSGTSISIVHARAGKYLKDLEKKIGKPFEHVLVPNGEEVCEKSLFNLIELIRQIEVDEEQILPFLTDIFNKFENLSKEEIIKKLVWVEFNRFLSYYKDSADLNITSRSGKDSRSKRDRKRRNEVDFDRFYINLGSSQDLSAQRLMGIVNEKMRSSNVLFGKIEIMKKFSFFEIDKEFTNELLSSFNNAKYKGEQLLVELVKKSKTPHKKKEKSERGLQASRPFQNHRGQKRAKHDKRKKDKNKKKKSKN